MTLAKLLKELDFAITMANIGRDPAWNVVIVQLDEKVKEKTKNKKA